MKKFCILCLVSLTSLLSAFSDPAPGEFSLSAEWLYMLPAYSQPYYVIDSSSASDVDGPRVSNTQEWQSGWRIEGRYAFCCRPNQVVVRWTQMPSFSMTGSRSSRELFQVLAPDPSVEGLIGTSFLTDRFSFHYLEALFNQTFLLCGPFAMDFQVGIHYGLLELEESCLVDASFTTNRLIDVQSKRWGVGPQVGYEFTYALTSCFSITGRGNVALLVSERESRFLSTLVGSTPALDVRNESYCDVIPVTNLRFGLNALLPRFWCGQFALDVGYEVLTYTNGLDRLFFTDSDEEGISYDELMDFTLHGPYIHLGFTF